MIKIRLTRIGKKHQPSYRLVVTPKENPAKGQYLELLGTYNPLQNHIAFDSDKVMAWLNKGAQPSNRVARLLDKAGLKHKSIIVKQFVPKPKEDKVSDEKPKKIEPADSSDDKVEDKAKVPAS